MKVGECRSELSVLARRGRLSSADEARLTAHLGACEECRLTFRLRTAFDGAATLGPDDGMRIARLGIAARRWAESGSVPAPLPPRRFNKSRILLIAACWGLVALVGSAAAHVLTRTPETPQLVEGPPEARPLAARPQAASRSAPRSAPVAELPVEPAFARLERAKTESAPAPKRAPLVESAKVLFQKASSARRTGDSELARSLYQRLQREFPASSEASLATLRLGSLLLEQGSAAAALQQFERYLAGGGGLAPEALYGRGRALALLGRGAEERQTWARLLRDFPACPYAAHARRRLDAGASATPGAR